MKRQKGVINKIMKIFISMAKKLEGMFRRFLWNILGETKKNPLHE